MWADKASFLPGFFFFSPSFSILSDLGTKLHERQDWNNSVLGDVRRPGGLYFRAGDESCLLCSSGSWDVVGEGAVNRIIYLG